MAANVNVYNVYYPHIHRVSGTDIIHIHSFSCCNFKNGPHMRSHIHTNTHTNIWNHEQKKKIESKFSMINRNFWNFFPNSLSSQIALFQFCLALSLSHIFSFFFSLSIHILLLSPLDISRIFWAYYHYHHSSLICSGSIKILIHRICMKKERKNNKILATYTHRHTHIYYTKTYRRNHKWYVPCTHHHHHHHHHPHIHSNCVRTGFGLVRVKERVKAK